MVERTYRSMKNGMSIMPKLLLALLSAAFLSVGLTGCSAAESLTVSDDTTIIDVRTSAEYEAGHLDGAVNIDVSSSDFAAEIQKLPADGHYVVYCQSGNRSAQAVSLMHDQGFTNLQDAGGINSASDATGIRIVAS